MTTKAKILILCAGLVAVLALSLVSYWRGRKVGVATTKMVDVTKELSQLEGEKLEIRQNVHALDTNALRNRILEQSDRLTKESQAADSK